MPKSRYDRIFDKIETRLARVNKKIGIEFKGKDPFDSVKITDAEKIAKYLTMTPDVKLQLYQDFGEEYINYEKDMEQKIRGYGNAANR